ncbi:unnamed protein product [Calypogeia fissa]
MMTTCGDKEADVEMASPFPQEIVDKIIAMMPFPSIFKARGLSKSWRARFSSISLLEGKEKECNLAESFQKQVIGEWSKKWDSFCPVLVGEDDLLAYGQKSRNWLKLSLSFLPEMSLHSRRSNRYTTFDRYRLQVDGALLHGSHHLELYVADILTQRWKQLPPLPWGQSYVVCSKVLSKTSLGTYKMLLLCHDDCRNDPNDNCLHGHDHYSAKIYESSLGTWSTQNFAVTRDFFYGATSKDNNTASAAYLNGVLYVVAFNNVQHLLALNVAEGTLQELELSFNDGDGMRVEFVNLLVCNENRLMMVTRDTYPEHMQVLKVDLQTLQLVQVSRGPPAPFRVGSLAPKPLSHGDCIFFRTHNRRSGVVLAYNVVEEAWSSFAIPAPVFPIDYKTYHWIGASFQPALSAFVAL